ncbi:hypothetical protein F4813DRAFT_356500, partial [Daldinia decipiens]|uniref:uncharacterized protein n=1 Tax=Daldinia decipiens TaxID=326647 RepID=UPI0020C430E2
MDQDQDQKPNVAVHQEEEFREWSPPLTDFGFNLTRSNLHCIPQDLLDVGCSKLYIEFLLQFMEPGTEGPDSDNIAVTTHTVMKADFVTPHDQYKGVRIAMNLDSQEHCPELGVLGVKFRTYSGRTTSSMRTFVFALHDSVKVGQLLEAMTSNNMQYFLFDYDANDKIKLPSAQAFYQLETRGYVSPQVESIIPEEPQMPSGLTAYDVLPMAFNRQRGHIERSIGRGKFPFYTRVEEPYMKYDDKASEEV